MAFTPSSLGAFLPSMISSTLTATIADSWHRRKLFSDLPSSASCIRVLGGNRLAVRPLHLYANGRSRLKSLIIPALPTPGIGPSFRRSISANLRTRSRLIIGLWHLFCWVQQRLGGAAIIVLQVCFSASCTPAGTSAAYCQRRNQWRDSTLPALDAF